MIAVKALYDQGQIRFLDPPPDIARSLVAIVFLEMEPAAEDTLASYEDVMDVMDWGRPMDEAGARALVAMHEELAPYRAAVNQALWDRETE